MSQYHHQQTTFPLDRSAGPTIEFDQSNYNSQHEESEGAQSPKSRREQTNYIFEKLYKATLIRRQGERDAVRTSQRLNKNEILGVTLARLTKEEHLNGINYSRDIELVRGLHTKINTNDFVLVLRTDGRIVAMTDEAEQHFGKSMRSLYTQCINIFQCLNKNEGKKMRAILNSASNAALVQQEHRLVCAFRLPKGKRPSRAQEDVKTINMVGHFYTCHDASSSSVEKLFVVRCEALLSRGNNGSNASQSTLSPNNDNTNSMIRLTLNEDMTISVVSSNVKDILGYHRNEIHGSWFGRYLSTNDLERFETIRKKYFENDGRQQQSPASVCDIFDILTNHGDGRLTFLFQIRSVHERRSKAIKYTLVGQLIDPSLRSEYLKYTESQLESDTKSLKDDEVNQCLQLSTWSTAQTSQEPIMAYSPSLEKSLFVLDGINNFDFISSQQQQQHSPFHRSLSNVAPIDFDDDLCRQLLSTEYDQTSTTSATFSNWPNKAFDDISGGQQFEQELNEIFAEYLHNY